MSQNPTNATYWKKQAEEARTLAREAGEALMYVHLPHPPVKVPCSACAILTKLRAAGLMRGGE